MGQQSCPSLLKPVSDHGLIFTALHDSSRRSAKDTTQSALSSSSPYAAWHGTGADGVESAVTAASCVTTGSCAAPLRSGSLLSPNRGCRSPASLASSSRPLRTAAQSTITPSPAPYAYDQPDHARGKQLFG